MKYGQGGIFLKTTVVGSEMWARLHASVRDRFFAVASRDGMGSAFAVTDRDLLTNKHVVEKTGNGAEVKILHQDWRVPVSGHV